MKRRAFTKLATLSAVAVSTSGFIRFNGKSFEGNCETTTDILGPFYRPDSPVRDNLVIEGAPGEIVELSGIIKHKDCITPYKGAKVELWHCSADEVYDNDSDEFRYRGTTFCDENGHYEFITQMPVPYDAGGGNYRPAHFHMLISAPHYQPLVTQIYFTGDPYLEKDLHSASPAAASRTLEVQEENNMKKVVFDVIMNDRLMASSAALDKVVGVYTHAETGESIEFFKKEKALWMKNEVFGHEFEYVGNNTFSYPGLPPGFSSTLHFGLQKDGSVQLTQTYVRGEGERQVQLYTRR